jgi:hypothetical protein
LEVKEVESASALNILMYLDQLVLQDLTEFQSTWDRGSITFATRKHLNQPNSACF